MKKQLFLVLKNSSKAHIALEELKKEGLNATIVSSESLHHIVDDFPEEQHFFNLRHYEQKQFAQSVLCLFIVDEEQLENVKQTIRKYTNNFQDIKGFMYSQDINDYEGSF